MERVFAFGSRAGRRVRVSRTNRGRFRITSGPGVRRLGRRTFATRRAALRATGGGGK